MKSILHEKKDRTCLLCMWLHNDDSTKSNLHEHHVIHGWANRRLSEKHGLKVYLCLNHHEIGPEAVHKNDKLNKMLKAYAQKMFEQKWPEKDFYSIFKKNYIMDLETDDIEENQEESDTVAGFTLIEDGLEGVDWQW